MTSISLKIRVIALLLWFLPMCALFAQEGNFLLTHHVPRAIGMDHTNFDILYDQQGLINVANRQGVLRYDGHQWGLVYTSMAVFALAEDANGTLYVAGEGDYGRLAISESGELVYESLRKEARHLEQEWFDVVVHQGKVYFLSAADVVVFDPEVTQETMYTLGEDTEVYFRSLFSDGEVLYLEGEDAPMHQLTDDGLAVLAEPLLPDSAGDMAFLSRSPLGDKVLYGTHRNLWLSRGGAPRPVFTQIDSLISESWLLDAEWINDTLVAVGTLNQGVFFLNPLRETLVQHINYHTGLPDNEVLAMAVDADMGIWVAHEFGFSRISPALPIRSFAHYPGLEGNLLEVKRHQGDLYVATSLGVFYLEQIRNYQESIYYVRKRDTPIPIRRQETPVRAPENPEPQEAEATEEQAEESGGFFRNLFSKRAREERQVEREQAREERQEQRATERSGEEGFLKRIFSGGEDEQAEQPEISYERRVRRELQSVRYVFKKVMGLDAKCKQLVSVGDRLIIGSHSGVYEVSEGKAVLINDQPVQYLYATQQANRLVLSTLYDEVLMLELRGDVWVERALDVDLRAPVTHINEDAEALWLVSPDQVVRYPWVAPDSGARHERFRIANPNYEPLYAVNRQGQMYFVCGEGYFRYHQDAGKVEADEELAATLGLPAEYHFASGNHLWLYNGRRWEDFTADPSDSVYLDYLVLFEHIQHLSVDDETGHLWITTPSEEMYQYDFHQPPVWQSVHELVLIGVHGKGGVSLPRHDFVISKENSYVSFEFTRPDFLGKLGIEYRYRLAGLGNEWSDWNPQSTITFNYLPPGDYTLEVQARDAFGNENKPYIVDFGVVPPWWERGWFYALEVVIFATFLLISFRLNRTTMRRSILSRVLTYLTLILIIEFLQNLTKTQLTLGGNPIAEFGLEAAIAFALLPLEGLLRKFILLSERVA